MVALSRYVTVLGSLLVSCQALISDEDDNIALLAAMRVKMQPVVVAKLLSQVENRWERDAVAELRDEISGGDALAETEASCQKVTKSIVAGAAGNKERAVEYMKEVCGSDKDLHDKKSCESYSAGLSVTMTEDAYHNREELNLVPFCKKMYIMFLEEHEKQEKLRQDVEQKRKAQEDVARQKQEEADRVAQEAGQLHADANEAMEKIAAAEKNARDAANLEASMGADADDAAKATKSAQKKYQVADEREVAEAEAAALRTAEAARKSRVTRVTKVVRAAKAARIAKQMPEKRPPVQTPLHLMNQVAVEENEVEDEATDRDMMGAGPLIIGFVQSPHTSSRGLPQSFFLQQ